MTGRPALLLLVMAGFLVWSAVFVALYAGLSIGCAFGWNEITIGPTDLLRLLLIGGFAAGLAALTVTAMLLAKVAHVPPPAGFVTRTGYWAALVAVVAGAFTFAPVLFTTACI